jgi:hypothetical protein
VFDVGCGQDRHVASHDRDEPAVVQCTMGERGADARDRATAGRLLLSPADLGREAQGRWSDDNDRIRTMQGGQNTIQHPHAADADYRLRCATEPGRAATREHDRAKRVHRTKATSLFILKLRTRTVIRRPVAGRTFARTEHRPAPAATSAIPIQLARIHHRSNHTTRCR